MVFRESRGANDKFSQAIDRLPRAHTVFANLKTCRIGTFHGFSPKHLQRYLDEFVFRFDRRRKEAELFPWVRHRAINTKPFPYHHFAAEQAL